MVTLGLDIGERRIGVAVSDPTGLVARPLTVVARRSLDAVATALRAILSDTGAGSIVAGLPVSLDDSIGPQAERTLAAIRGLERRLNLTIGTVDERMTTVEAEQIMRDLGWNRRKRQDMIDAAAAAVILQQHLDSRRSGATRP